MFKYDLIDLKTVDKTLKNKQLAKKKVRIIHNNRDVYTSLIITTESKF